MHYAPFLSLLEEKIVSLIDLKKDLPAELYAPQQYILSLGGKRLRPLLAMIGADLFDGDIHKAIPAALSVELFHNFSLIHDDILDKAPLRRGQKTIHKKWNTDIAILSGDALLVRAYEELAMSDEKSLRELFVLFNQTAKEVCEGQQEDMNFEKIPRVSVAQYTEMITKKTAVLLACSLKMGAVSAGAKQTDARKLYECGKHLGIAFQLKDDILDVYGDKDKFGKQEAGDILSNKKTFLLLKALELSNARQLQELESWLMKKDYKPAEKIAGVKKVFEKLKIRAVAEQEVNFHFETAMNCLSGVKAGNKKKNNFRTFCEELMQREK
jgi:geranylgeranyl diphosphate synthase, type II